MLVESGLRSVPFLMLPYWGEACKSNHSLQKNKSTLCLTVSSTINKHIRTFVRTVVLLLLSPSFAHETASAELPYDLA